MVTSPNDLPRTVGELRASGHVERGVKAEIRENLLAALRRGRDAWPGILGFEDTVLPQLERALIAGHDVVLLGERGQGKTRLLRALTGLLDEWTPVIAGSELSEHPYRRSPPSPSGGPPDSGDDLPVEWRHRSERYTEKLATPDTSVADLVGDIDPIKVAEGRSLGDPETIAYGLVPRAHRGIVAINELPDLAERIQVSMLNVMEERDIQVRGYTLRLPLDVCWWPAPTPRTTPTAAASSPRSRTASAPRCAPTTRTSSRREVGSSARRRIWPPRCPSICGGPRPVRPLPARVAVDRPGFRCVGAVRDRGGRDGRRVGPAPLGARWGTACGGPAGRPRAVIDRAARQAGVRLR